MATFDFNNYITQPAVYTINPTGYTFSNAPTTLTNVFTFSVAPAFQSNSAIQIVNVAGSNIVYARQWDAGVFGEWETVQGGGEAQNYKGTYNASTNTPTLTNGVGTVGDYYIVTVAGTNNPTEQNLAVGNSIVYNGSVWQDGGAVANTDAIVIASDYSPSSGTIVAGTTNLTTGLGYLAYDIENLPIANTMTTLGDTIYGGASGVPIRLAGNTSTTVEFLKSVGNGTNATAPVWSTIALANLSDIQETSLADANLLIYNLSATKWENQALSGDITITNAGVSTIGNNKVSNTKLGQMPTLTIKGNNTGSTANALDLTVSQVQSMLDVISNTAISITSYIITGSTYNTIYLIKQDATTVGLPASPVADVVYTIKNAGNFTSNTISGNSKYIDGSTIVPLSAYQCVRLYYDGTQYWTV